MPDETRAPGTGSPPAHGPRQVAAPGPHETDRSTGPRAADTAGSGPTDEPGEGAGGQGDRAVVRDALGVGIAVGLSGFAFGVTAAGSGISLAQMCALSFFVFTGASQFALVSALAAGGSPLTAAAGAFFLGTRNAFYGLRLSGLLGLRPGPRLAAAHWVIDETSAVALAQRGRRAGRLGFTVTGATLFLLWNLTTLLGALGAEALGDTGAWGLDAAGPAAFLALLAPMLRTGVERVTAALAACLGLGLLPVLPAGVPVLVAALAAPAVLFAHSRTPVGRAAGGRAVSVDGTAESVDGRAKSVSGPVESARVTKEEDQ
ncbi:AzlC family ABC transporter permease [Streptomyces albus subsp. chlorinus]|uniref:AzlC family ABC transporter permease n=1 Tax=Streptomyces albus TaxID=1888 RepID=UPI00156E9B00|nr:AzlC family ABC transporter permease [Streptomyces albus]NSC24251.1 AzlC family ABC transporter permease [Streptomyces albus subsp. chlorinus]